MVVTNDIDAWRTTGIDDLWIFDKFILSRMAGHVCGTRGMTIKKTGWYCVRPVINFEGMGYMARKEWLERGDDAYHLHPGEFWCQWFDGEHLSVDYRAKKPILTVRASGGQSLREEMWRFGRWDKVPHSQPWPEILDRLAGIYHTINCEFIGGNIIETHLRANPDFDFGNDYMIPVWRDGAPIEPKWNEVFIPDDPETDPHVAKYRLGRIVGKF
jgi:hypothetical protein